MVGQISGIYFQAYQLAYDVAKRAEKAYRFELGLDESDFIRFGYWDSLKKGLLAAEKMQHDLRRMEVAYLEKNKREFELTKHVSLALLHPQALMSLRETGKCYFHLPEAIFDLDHSGHFMRRIKSVSLTIPCVTGPYTSVSGTLMLQSNRIRKTTRINETGYPWNGNMEDDRFIYDIGGIQSIATSSANGDSGLFELNFRDERYLPFEGAGVISQWSFELPSEFRQFDYDTISDLIVHLQYTARNGGARFRDAVQSELSHALNSMLVAQGKSGLYRYFSARQEFPNEWHQFLHAPLGTDGQAMSLPLTLERFPYPLRNKGIHIRELQIYLLLKALPETYEEQPLFLGVTPEGDGEQKALGIGSQTEFENVPQATWDYGEYGVLFC